MNKETMDVTIICPHCNTPFEKETHSGLRWMAAGAGIILGGAVSRSFLGGAMIGAVSYGIAAAIDELQSRRCPACHRMALDRKDIVASAAEEGSIAH